MTREATAGPVGSWVARAPWTWALTGLALIAAFLQSAVPGTTEALILVRGAVADGEAWRLLTGHLAHLNGVHLLWNVLPFFVLGCVYEPRLGARRFGLLLAASALAVDVAVLAGGAGVQAYAGISGVATGLFAAGAAQDLRASWGGRDGGPLDVVALGAPVLALAFLVLKLSYEVATGRYLFLDGHLPGVAVPAAHLVGATAGLAVVLPRSRSTRAPVEAVA